MDLAQRKEQFCNAYIRAVAAVSGFTVYKPEVDDDSVDTGIAARGGGGTIRSPRLELQLKGWGSPAGDKQKYDYPLKVKNYNELVPVDLFVPRILVVVVVPKDLKEWLRQSETQLTMKHCAYWVSLRGQPESANDQTVTVPLPRKQQLTAAALTAIMSRLGGGSLP